MAIAEAAPRPTGIGPEDPFANGLPPKAAESPVAPAVQHLAAIKKSSISISVGLSDGVIEVEVSRGVFDSMQRLLTEEQRQEAFKDWATKERNARKERALLQNKPSVDEKPVITLPQIVVYLDESDPHDDHTKAEGYSEKPLPGHTWLNGFGKQTPYASELKPQGNIFEPK